MITKLLIYGIIALIVGIFLLITGIRKIKSYFMIKDIPTSKIRSVAIGISEIIGKSFSKSYLKSPVTKSDCVYYKYEVKEYRRHRTKDRTYYSWDQIYSTNDSIPFKIKDETGEIDINPKSAEFNVKLSGKYYQSRPNILSGFLNINLSSLTEIDTSSKKLVQTNGVRFFSKVGDRMYYEYMVSSAEETYVIGTTKNINGKLIIEKGENNNIFIISDKSEKELLKSIKSKIIINSIISIGLIILSIYLLFFQYYFFKV